MDFSVKEKKHNALLRQTKISIILYDGAYYGTIFYVSNY